MIARVLLLFLMLSGSASAEVLRLAATTSFENSGLAEVLLPLAKAETGIEVRLVVVGTGQALRLGAAGDVDAVLVHARSAEEDFVAEGHGTHRTEIMFNDFVLIGPASDPAGAGGAATVAEAFARVRETGAAFISRGDDSGTHQREVTIWEGIGGVPAGAWYRPVGAGMGAALNTAAGMDAYVLADRGTWLSFGNRAGLKIVFEGDPVLVNQYAYLPVNPVRHPHVAHDAALRFEAWLTSPATQDLIGSYRVGGEALFVPNARP